MKQELISVIIPTYNQSIYLKDCLKSILKQTYKHFEILVCDDGSTDDTKKVVLDFKDKRIHYFQNKHSGFHSVPRNIGLKNAKGKYIAYIDSDDLMEPNRLFESLKFLRKNKSVDILCTNAWMINEHGKSLGKYEQVCDEGIINLRKLLLENYIICSTVVMKSSAAKDIGFHYEKETKFYTDYEYWLRAVCKNKKIYYMNKALVKYRYHNNSISRKTNPHLAIVKQINTYNILLMNKFNSKLQNIIVSRQLEWYSLLIKFFLRKRNFNKVFLLIINVFLHHPLISLIKLINRIDK